MSCRFKMNYLCVAISAAVAGIVLGHAALAQAGALGSPNVGNGWSTISAVSIGGHSGEAGSREIINTINGSGISGVDGELHVAGVPFGTMGLFRGNSGAHAGTVAGSHWAEYVFDQTYSLGEMWLWNWNENAEDYEAFGWKNMTVEYSTDGSSWSTAFAGIVPMADGSDPNVRQLTLDFGGALAKYVVLTNTGALGSAEENWSNGKYTNDAGLSEVRFYEVVPEPATFVLLLVGLGLLLPIVRTRTRTWK